MTARERQGWVIVACLFVTLFLVFGSGYNTSGLFFPRLLKHFGWSHSQTALLTSVLALAAGAGAPLIGWLLDRFEARVVMIAGVLLSASAFLIASRAGSFAVMMTAYVILGIGISAATLLPVALIIANWFGENRGLAMALTFSGTSLGGFVMNPVGNYAIEHFGGWRSAYVVFAAPMLLIVIPLILWQVRTRPHEAGATDFKASTDALLGLEVGEAILTRSFWMICIVNFTYGCAAAGMNLHMQHYLANLGYTPAYAALMFGLVLFFSSVGKLGMGFLSDRISARIALTVNFAVAAIGTSLIFGVSNSSVLFLFVVVFGLSVGAPLVLIPLLSAEAMGLRRFGSIGGWSGIFNTLGAFIGPYGAGVIADHFLSYSIAFEVFVTMCIVGAIATFACLTLEEEQTRLARLQPAAA